MGLTRRNTIIGLGALAGGTGALAASGAFTAVEAQREVSIDTAGDDDALLQIRVDDESEFDGIGGGDDDVITITAEDINLNAITRFEDALEISTESDGSWDVKILDDFDGSSIVDSSRGDLSESDPRVSFVGDTTARLSDNTSVNYDIIINTLGVDSTTNFDDTNLVGDDDNIVIEAGETGQ